MNPNLQNNKQLNKVPGAFIKSLLSAYLLSFILLLIFALLLYAFGGSQRILSIGIISIYIISTFVCGYLCGHMMKNRKYLWGSLSGLLYFILLFLLSFCFPGAESQTSNTLTALIICVASAAIGGMLA